MGQSCRGDSIFTGMVFANVANYHNRDGGFQFMSKERLQRLKSIATWSGVFVTLCGIALNLASGGSWWSNSLSFFGVIITCCGHWITNALAKHQAKEKEADQKKTEQEMWRIKRRIDRIKYGAGGALGHDIEDETLTPE